MLAYLSVFPICIDSVLFFCHLSVFFFVLYCNSATNDAFYKSLISSVSSELESNLNFKHVSKNSFNSHTSGSRNSVDTSLFHMNVRSLNKNCHNLRCVFQQLPEPNRACLVGHVTWYTESYRKLLVGVWYTRSHKLFHIRKVGGLT